MKSTVNINTKEGKNYIGKLCRHFRHKIEATYADNEGKAIFPKGICRMKADSDTLTFDIEAENAEAVAKIQGVIDRHLIKFAFREQLDIQWQPVND